MDEWHLHLACFFSASAEVVRCLLRSNLSGSRKLDVPLSSLSLTVLLTSRRTRRSCPTLRPLLLISSGWSAAALFAMFEGAYPESSRKGLVELYHLLFSWCARRTRCPTRLHRECLWELSFPRRKCPPPVPSIGEHDLEDISTFMLKYDLRGKFDTHQLWYYLAVHCSGRMP